MDMSPQLVAYVSYMAKFTAYDAVRDGFTTPGPSTLRIPPMPATCSAPCRPGIPPHAGHLFRRMSAGREPGRRDCA
jgi:hypothetical protein